MKQLEDIIKDRLDDYELKLPSMDQQSFWSTKAVRERAAKRRRSYLGVAVGLPAAAAILCGVLLSIHLMKPTEPAKIIGGIPPSVMGLPESYNDLDIIYNLASEIPEFSQLPVSAGDCVTGLIHRLYQDEYKPFKGVNVDEFDNSGKIVNHTLTDENGYFSISIINPADSILIHADGYEPMKFEIFRTDGQIAGFILDETDEVSLVVSDAPEFPGGTQALQKFITSNMEYPSDALRDSIKGRVLVQFTVEKDGSITDIEVLKHVHPLLDKEAVRIVSGMPRWIPGKHFGFPRRVRYTIPVTFRLDNSTKPGPAVTDNDRVEEDILADPNDKTF